MNFEKILTDSSGHKREMVLTKAPLKDHSGNILGVIGMHREAL